MNPLRDSQRLSVEHLHHAYDSKTVLADVSFAAQTGDIIGIVGRNGAGKSTLLRSIAGLLQPTSGRIDLVGQVTAIMTLGLGLYEDLSGRENARANFDINGCEEEQWAAVDAQIEDFSELGDFYDRPVRTYSTGMKSRLSFAMLTHVDPEILIIDEALSAGDSRFANKAYARLRTLCTKGTIVLIVSHSMGTIVDLCTRCLWLDEGRIRMDGPPGEVTTAYHDAVREMDDANLLEKSQARLKSQVALSGFTLDMPVVSDGYHSDPRSLLYAGDPMHVRLRGSTNAESNKTTDLRVVVERLDGLVMMDARTWNDANAPVLSPGGQFDLELIHSPLVLGVGRYFVTAELLQQGQLAARAATLIEVSSRRPPSGGHPLLLAPYDIDFVESS